MVVLTDKSFEYQFEVNKWCRKYRKRFISTDARGLFAYVFVDLGSEFLMEDANGEACKEVIINHVDSISGDVHTLDKAFHGFEDGDYVTFSEVVGMTELNNCKPIKIIVKSKRILLKCFFKKHKIFCLNII